jgi:hypothetical protein
MTGSDACGVPCPQARINCIHSRPQLRALEEHDSVHQETGPSHVTGLGAGSNLISST